MSADINEYLQISLLEDDELLQTQWLRKVNAEEYRAAVLKMRDIVLESHVKYWLIDSRKLNGVPYADQQWIKREIAPIVANSRLEKFARVLTEDVFNYIAFENLLQGITEDLKTRVEIGQFTSVEAARAWLLMDDK